MAVSTIAILERYALLSSGMRSILLSGNADDFIIEAKSVHDLVSMLNKNVPDIIIIDIVSADNLGLKPLKNLRRKYPKVPVLLIVSEYYADCFEDYIRLGVKGFLFNTSDGEELLIAVNNLKKDKEYFPDKLWKVFKDSIQNRKLQKSHDHRLTDREVSVVRLFSSGLTYKEIGAQLNISPRTVETHKRNILSKLKIHTTADMVKYAYRNNIFT